MKRYTEKPKMYIIRKYVKAVDVKVCKHCNREYKLNKKYSLLQKQNSLFCSNICSSQAKDYSHLKTPERKEKMRNFMLGKKISDETKRKMSESSKKYSRLKGAARGRAWKGGISLQPGYKNMMWWKRRAIQMNAEGTHSNEEWQLLKEKYSYMCLCCKKQEPFVKLTQDHIIPLSRGGSDYICNIQPLCQQCNSRKNTKIIDYTNNFVPASAIGFNDGVVPDEE